MYKLDNVLNLSPFSYSKYQKEKIFNKYFKKLNKHHYKNCSEYRRIVKTLNYKLNNIDKIQNYPMLPINMFKVFDLMSVKKSKIIRKVFSSGTSGELSKIFLDKENSNNQMKVLTKIMKNILGNERLPMLIIDQDPLSNRKQNFNAKSAAIFGFSLFGKNHCYILDKNKNIKLKLLKSFLKKYKNKKFIIFGFTSQIFEYLLKKKQIKYPEYNFENGILLHGGGWKKLEEFRIDNKELKKKLKKKLHICNIYNYYGLVEQTGSIFIEGNNCGYLHTSIFSDIIIRDKNV